MTEFYDSLETRSSDERAAAQLAALRAQLSHVKNSTSAYADALSQVDAESINDLESFATLPLTRKSELLALQGERRPFGGYTADNSAQLTHVFASPGPIYEPGFAVADFWRFARSLYASGFRRGDLVHNCFSYHFTPAGQMFDSAAQALGCAVIPAGVGQTELQVQTISDLSPSAYVGTPSFLKIILEQADELGSDVSSLNKAMVSGEALPAPLRTGFVERGVRVQQCYGTADLGLIAYESSAQEGLRRTYSLMAKQFLDCYKKALSQPGVTGMNMLRLLESRLDNIVFRMGLASSRAHARQMILHGHVRVNGKKVTIPSFQCVPGNEVSLPAEGKWHKRGLDTHAVSLTRGVPEWLQVDPDKLVGTYRVFPERGQLDQEVQENLVVEFFSR